MANNEDRTNHGDFNFLIVRPENGGVLDLFKFLVLNSRESGAKFLEGSSRQVFDERLLLSDGEDGGGETPAHRWVIFVSIVARKIIKVLGKPMEWTGYIVEFVLNLLSLNGCILGLLYNIFRGKVVIPKRGSQTFISAIGHLDGRQDLYKFSKEINEAGSEEKNWRELGNCILMDLCMMASKLAYENANVVKKVVDIHWKMHFVDFYNCWDDYQKDLSTQVFIMCDKPEDAELILVSFRGTEPFDADDWITDFDYSWYEIPKLGKVHMGFLEALGLGNRINISTFKENLLLKTTNFAKLNGFHDSLSESSCSGSEKELVPMMRDKTAYYIVKSKLKDLIAKNKNAKFVVTGHSLGGALAILFPTVLVLHEEEEIMSRMLGVYTYGQPRVGNRQLGRFMEAHLEHPEPKYFRVVYCNDLVPRLPYDDKTFLYKHFGICLYYNSLYIEQNVKEEPNRNYIGLRYMIPLHLNAGWEFVRSLMMRYMYGPDYGECWESILLRVVGLALPGLSAHSPVNYINSVRLGRMRS